LSASCNDGGTINLQKKERTNEKSNRNSRNHGFPGAWCCGFPARVDEAIVEKRDLKSVAVAPIEKPRDGKNVALTLEVKPATSKRLPRGVSIGVNGKSLDLLDDGNWPDITAGDGIYTLGLKTKDGKPLKEGGSLRLSEPTSSTHSRFATGLHFQPCFARSRLAAPLSVSLVEAKRICIVLR